MQQIDPGSLAAYIELAKYGVILAGFIVLGTTIVTGIAFYNAGPDKARIFSEFIERARVLQLVTVLTIILAVGILTFMSRITSEGAISIYSGIAGYVLGGLRPFGRAGRTRRSEENLG